MVNSISIALTGLSAASKQLSASASNIANVNTVGSLEEGAQAPYTPIATQNKAISDGQGNPQGVATNFVARDNPFAQAYDPDSPFANADGIIGIPNINLGEEIVNVGLAKLQFKANIATLQTAQELSEEIFKIFDERV